MEHQWGRGAAAATLQPPAPAFAVIVFAGVARGGGDGGAGAGVAAGVGGAMGGGECRAGGARMAGIL